MADGLPFEISSSKLRVKFQEDASEVFVIKEIENLVDGTKISFPDRDDLFEFISRDGATLADTFATHHPKDSTTDDTAVIETATTDYLITEKAYFQGIGRPNLGSRTRVRKHFTYTIDGDTLLVDFVAEILDDQPDRLRCYLALAWVSATPNDSIFWVAPLVLHVLEFTADEYFIATNGGLVTRDPKTDIATIASNFLQSSAFEPETLTGDLSQLEQMHPGHLSVAASAYGDRGATRAVIYLHDDMRFAHKRIIDSYDGVDQFVLKHQQLAGSPSQKGNNFENQTGQGDKVHKLFVTYCRLFKKTGDVMGEEIGLDWRRWVLSAGETNRDLDKELFPEEFWLKGKPRDRTDMALMRRAPIFLRFTNEDAAGATGVTDDLPNEMTELFAMPVTQFLPRYVPEINEFQFQVDGDGHPAPLKDAVEDLFNLRFDDARRNQAQVLFLLKMMTIGQIFPRRPSMWDAGDADPVLGSWHNDGFENVAGTATARRRNHFEEWNDINDPPAYRSVATWLKTTSTVSANNFDGTWTRVLVASGFDSDHFKFFTKYALDIHAAHDEHLGWVRIENSGGDRYYAIERQQQSLFDAGTISIAGDVAADIDDADPITLFWTHSDDFIPGYSVDTDLDNLKTTSICPFHFDFTDDELTPTGPYFRLKERLKTQYGQTDAATEAATGIVFLGNRDHLTCSAERHSVLGSTFIHWGPEHDLIKLWRKVLRGIRKDMVAQHGHWFALDEFGPDAYLLGESDGSTRTFVRNDIGSADGSWGYSPFFVTALGDFARSGTYAAGHHGTTAGVAGIAAVENGAIGPTLRQAIVADWLLCRKTLSLFLSADATTSLIGTLPSGKTGRTPFVDASFGRDNLTSISALMSRMIQFQTTFDYANFEGKGARSLQRIGTATVPLTPENGAVEDHNVGITELGRVRAQVVHAVIVDPANPRRLIAVFVNDAKTATADAYRFKPSFYDDTLPGTLGGYRMTQYTFSPTGVVTKDLGQRADDFAFTVSLTGCGLVAVVFDFSSALQFIYHYDGDAETKVPIPSDQDRVRVADIHGGPGERITIGFETDLPDEDFAISAIELRWRALGKSEER